MNRALIYGAAQPTFPIRFCLSVACAISEIEYFLVSFDPNE